MLTMQILIIMMCLTIDIGVRAWKNKLDILTNISK
jgi:hypothetical protein